MVIHPLGFFCCYHVCSPGLPHCVQYNLINAGRVFSVSVVVAFLKWEEESVQGPAPKIYFSK